MLCITNLLKKAKVMYWENKFQETKHDMTKTWENINKLLNKKKGNDSHPTTFSNGNTIYTTPTQIANAFNNYFTNIGPSLAANIPATPRTAERLLPNFSTHNSLYLTPTTPYEVQNIIKKMKPKTSLSHDDISPKIIKKCSEHIIEPLTDIINLSLSSGIFPDMMEIAKVIAIHKKDNPSHISNYRPISLLPTFSKILERIVYNRLYDFLTTHNLLTTAQYGFCKTLSTEYAILELQDRIVKNIANKEHCIGLFFDLSKVFDTLHHKILINKLDRLGIRGIPLNWFNSLLTNRQQYTYHLNNSSNLRYIICCVPQGSILGPLLFLIYI